MSTCLLVCIMLTIEDTYAQDVSSEYKVKAAFILNFARFTEWPEASIQSRNTFIIGIVGNNPFGGFLHELVRNESIRNLPIEVREFDISEDIDAHLLFVGNNVNLSRFPFETRSILTVSEIPEFTRRGGMIRLYTEEGRVRFEVNLEASRKAGITLSSRLLRLATICCSQK